MGSHGVCPPCCDLGLPAQPAAKDRPRSPIQYRPDVHGTNAASCQDDRQALLPRRIVRDAPSSGPRCGVCDAPDAALTVRTARRGSRTAPAARPGCAQRQDGGRPLQSSGCDPCRGVLRRVVACAAARRPERTLLSRRGRACRERPGCTPRGEQEREQVCCRRHRRCTLRERLPDRLWRAQRAHTRCTRRSPPQRKLATYGPHAQTQRRPAARGAHAAGLCAGQPRVARTLPARGGTCAARGRGWRAERPLAFARDALLDGPCCRLDGPWCHRRRA